jgi:CheY-like chemotaxis protein/nitrogen-specific signal transduction histidine kinase
MAKGRKKAKRVAQRAKRPPSRRAVEAALAGVAHDIRTPLTGVLALAELLAASDLPERERQWARAMKSGTAHLAALTNLIVDAARADAAGLVLQREPFSPRALAEAVGAALAARAANKSLTVRVAISPDLPALVAGDALRLRSALENLADNAVKFTGQGDVRFEASAAPARGRRVRLTFTFADSGIGMTQAELRRLFRPFAQASAEVARRYGGAGLGLTFVRRIARAMGGDLKVGSRKGEGSTFRMTVLAEPVADNRPATTPAGARPAAPLKLLCAEDNPYARVVMNTMLGELGHHVDFVDSGEAAVAAASRKSYDAVLMDVALPAIDGLEATRRIRALPGAAGRVPIIGISGRTRSDDAEAARAAGMDAYLMKPVSPEKLAEALSKLSSPAPPGDPAEPGTVLR